MLSLQTCRTGVPSGTVASSSLGLRDRLAVRLMSPSHMTIHELDPVNVPNICDDTTAGCLTSPPTLVDLAWTRN